MRTLVAIGLTLGAVSALPLSSLRTGLGVGHGHHFEQGVRESNHHNVQRHHQLGSLHHVDHHQPSLHHDVGHHPEDRHVHRLSSRHYLDIGGVHFGKRDTDEEEPPEQMQQLEEAKADGAEERAGHLGFGGYGLGLGYGLGPYGPYGLPYGLGYHGGYAGYGPYGIWKRSVGGGGSRSKRSPKPFGFGYGLGYGGLGYGGLGYGGLGGYGLGYGLYGHGLYGGHFWKRSSDFSSIKSRTKRSPSPYYGFGLGPYYGLGYGGYGLGGLYGHGLYGGHFWKRSAEDSKSSMETRKKRSPNPYYGFGFGPYYGLGYGLGGLYGGYGGLYGHGFWRRSVAESEPEAGKSKVKRSAEPFYGYHGYHDHHHHHHYPYHGYSYGW